jgi:hypothetical protein
METRGGKDMKMKTTMTGLVLGLALLAAQAGADVITAVANGTINDTATWGQAAPVSGDENTWRTGGSTIRGGGAVNHSTETFHGQTFIIMSNGTLRNNAANQTLFMNDLVLDGGIIVNRNNLTFKIDLGGKTLTLNSGTLQSAELGNTRNLQFQNAVLAGSGTITINNYALDYGTEVRFESTVATKGFTGAFDIVTGGVLKLSDIAVNDASFSLILSGGVYKNDANIAVTSLVIDGQAINAGTYGYADFSAGQQAFIGDNGGTITVIPEPATVGLLMVSSAAALLIRRIKGIV